MPSMEILKSISGIKIWVSHDEIKKNIGETVKNSGWLCHSVGSYKSLSFAGKSDYLVTVSGGSQPQLSVCSMSNKLQAKGGGLGFIQANNQTKNIFKAGQELVVYVDGDHEFVVFDPQSSQTHELSLTGQQNLATIEETGQLGYASMYGELPEFELKSKDDELWEATAPSRPSERPWESIFSGSSHDLPPLTKLCSPFLESLLERRTTTSTTAIVE
ncbi:hypothetical protein CsatB_013496 [Cannabis sativa]